MTDVDIREAVPNDHLGVMRVLDGGNLETDASTVRRRIDAGMVLVAVDEDRIIGALVAIPWPAGREDERLAPDPRVGREGDDATVAEDHGAHVESVAVRLRRRGQGIGTELMREAATRWRPLTADFYPGLSGFYEKLEFDIEKREGQFRGVLE